MQARHSTASVVGCLCLGVTVCKTKPGQARPGQTRTCTHAPLAARTAASSLLFDTPMMFVCGVFRLGIDCED